MREGALVLCVVAGCAGIEDRPASWSYVHAAIVQPTCARGDCHSRLTKEHGFDFSSREETFAVWRGVSCTGEPVDGEPSGLVTPHDPNSNVLTLVRHEGPIKMPPDQPLPAIEVELIERWIMIGAVCD